MQASRRRPTQLSQFTIQKYKNNMKKLFAIYLLLSVCFASYGQSTLPVGSKVISNTHYQAPDGKIYLFKGTQYAPNAYFLITNKVTIDSLLNLKVDKVTGKQLSTEDYSTAEKSKLLGIAPNATANSTDAFLLGRVNHTGTQTPSTILQDVLNRFVTDSEKASWNAKVTTEADPVFTAQKGAVNGVATLNGLGKIPNAQIPALALVDTYVVGSEAAMLALSTAEQGDVAIRTDLSKTFMLTNNAPGIAANWKELLSPIIPNETDPIWGASASAGITPANIASWNAKAPIASPVFTGVPTAPTAIAGTNTTQLATTAFVMANAPSGSYLPLSGGTLTGDLIRQTGALSARLAQDGLYSIGGELILQAPATHRIRMFAGGAEAYEITSAGNHNFKTGAATFGGALSGTTATFSSSRSSAYILEAYNTNTVAGTSFGMFIKAGTNASDLALNINNAANTVSLFQVLGNGAVNVAGALSGTSATFNAGVTLASSNMVLTGTSSTNLTDQTQIKWNDLNGNQLGKLISRRGATGNEGVMRMHVSNADVLSQTWNSDGSTALSGALTGTSATFSAPMTITTSGGNILAFRRGLDAQIQLYQDGTNYGFYNTSAGLNDLLIHNTTGAVTLRASLTGASATFSGILYGSRIDVRSGNSLLFWNPTNVEYRGVYSDASNNLIFNQGGAAKQTFTTGGGLDLTGALNGTSATFTSNVNSNTAYRLAGWDAMGYVGGTGLHIGGYNMAQWQSINFYTNGPLRYTIDAAGNNTWTGSGSFSGSITSTSGAIYANGTTSSNSVGGGSLLQIYNSVAARGWIQQLNGSQGLSWFHLNSTWTDVIQFSATGAITATGFFESSDLRYKDIISRTTSTSGFDMIKFKWKPELKRDALTHYGYVAQEVEKVYPDQVATDDKGYKSVNYTEVLVKKIADLENRIKQLEK